MPPRFQFVSPALLTTLPGSSPKKKFGRRVVRSSVRRNGMGDGKIPEATSEEVAGSAGKTKCLFPARYRKRPVVIDAMPWDGSRACIEACCRWVNEGAEEPILDYVFFGAEDVFDVQIATLEGFLNVSPGDWIIKGVQGEFYPCKPDIFAATYEPVSADSDRTAVAPEPSAVPLPVSEEDA